LLQRAKAAADRHSKPLLIHLSETKTEFDDAVKMRGKTPTKTLADLGLLGPLTVASHVVWLDDADIALLASTRTGVAHNPSSNMMLASGTARVVDLLKAGVNVGLGTDGVAGSNNDHNMIEEMDLAAKLQKVERGDPTALSAKQVFEMGTIGGARVLGMADRIGSIEMGKLADVISVRVTEPHALPVYDVYAQLVYALKGSDVTDVMVNGKLIVRDGRMLTLDRAAVLKKAAEYRAKIAGSLGGQR
jgi:5-methylthioadenosine/S-adenosylhomocysteine deaminase